MGQNASESGQGQFLGEYQLEARNAELNLTFLTHRDSRQNCLLRELTFSDPRDFQAAHQQLQRRLHTTHPAANKLIRVETQEEENMCSRVYRLYALWEHSPLTLAEEVNRRGLERTPFDRRQLYQLIRSMVGGLLHFCALGTKYEGLTTRAILVGWGGFKLADPLMLPVQRNLEVVHGHRNIKNIYLSPEECSAVQAESQGDGWRPTDAVFTAGLIALEAALLQRQDGCYLEQSSRVNWAAVGENLDRVRDRYGDQLREVLAGMLEAEVSKRVDLRELQENVVAFGGKATEKEWEGKLLQTHSYKKSLPIGGFSASQVSNGSKPTSPTFYSNQKLRLSLVDSLHSPQRLFETTHPRTGHSEQEIQSFSKQRPLPLLEMKTINTVTQVPQSSPPLFSFQRQLNTSPFPKNTLETSSLPPNSSNGRTCDSSKLILRKYEHHSPPLPPPSEGGYFVEEFKLGSRYEGFKVGGRREGWGKFHFQDGGLYEGEWHDNKMHGYGRLYYQSGKLAYEGQWQCDEFHGPGKLYNETYSPLREAFDYRNLASAQEFWMYYEGSFTHDVKEGDGLLRLSNGEYFRGRFERDEINGDGEYCTLGGRRVQGRWRAGILEVVHEGQESR